MTGVVGVEIFSASLVIFVFVTENYKSWLNKGCRAWIGSELDEILKKETLIWFLAWVGLILFLTFFLYLRFATQNDAFDYLSFGGPCISGIVAGFGILFKQPKNARVEKDVNLLFYFISVVILIICYMVYMERHFFQNVSYYVRVAICVALLLAVAIKRMTDVWLNVWQDWVVLASFAINVATFLYILILA